MELTSLNSASTPTTGTRRPAAGASAPIAGGVWPAVWLATVFALGSAGCGKSEPAAPQKTAAAKQNAPQPAKQETASAEEVAKEARADLRCPAKVSSAPRAADAPADDVVGVRPGLSYDEARNVVACTHDLLVVTAENHRGFNIKSYGQTVRQGFVARFAEPRVVKSSKQILKEMQDDAIARGGNARREDLKEGQAKWFVATMGMPGEERVLSAAREERFAADQSPTMESVREALIKKYGTPTLKQLNNGQNTYMRWARDPLGRAVTETSPLFNRCSGAASPDAGVHLTPDCGVVVEAQLMPQRSNPDLVERMQVGVVDEAGGFRMLSVTEQGLQKLDQQRRAQEVDRAAKNTKSPSL